MLNDQWFKQLPLTKITNHQPVSGGDINLAFKVIADNKPYFIKVQPNQPAKYFDHERDGLAALEQAIKVPHPVAQGEIEGNAFLILEWIESGWGDQFKLGQAVAKLHQITNDKFGFSTNHKTKVLVKDNHWSPNWSDFYVHQRLEPEIKAAKAKGVWNDWRNQHFEKMVAAFKRYYADHPVQPSLLHGDLWAGNFMFDDQGQPLLIDPDSVYGDREFDIAMTTIFGGFENDFYNGYQSILPLRPGLNNRLAWYQFYYLCMHLILFGESYGPSVDQILGRF